MASEELVFEYRFANLDFSVAMPTNKLRCLDENDMFGRGLLKEQLLKLLSKYPQ